MTVLQHYTFTWYVKVLHPRIKITTEVLLMQRLSWQVSFRPGTDPRSVSSMLGIAMRIAQRLGIHNESMNAKCSVLDAEMRRRLWWSLVIFDHRICELSDYKTTMLSPTWHCKTPLNINDLDIRAEMTSAPVPHHRPSETLFAVVRSEMSDFLRHSAFHLDFTNPALKALVKNPSTHSTHLTADSHGNELTALEQLMEDKYLSLCNPENPLHYMTIWVTRGHLARNRLLNYHARQHSPLTFSGPDSTSDPNSNSNPNSNTSHPYSQHDSTITYAMRMLECDTKLMASPLTKGYTWYMHNYFPFPAYIHIVRNLERRPTQPHAAEAWSVMSDNYDGRFSDVAEDDNPLFKVFSGAILQAWEARLSGTGQTGDTTGGEKQTEDEEEVPRIVVKIKRRLAELHAATTASTTTMNTQPGAVPAQDATTVPGTMLPTMQMDNMGGSAFPYGNNALAGPEFPDSWDVSSSPSSFGAMPGRGAGWFDYGPLDWSTMGWNPMVSRGW